MSITCQVGKPEAISLNDLANRHWDLPTERWAPITECVKFSPFTAGIDLGRQIRQELFIILPTHEPFVQRRWVHTGYDCAETRSQHLTSQGESVEMNAGMPATVRAAVENR